MPKVEKTKEETIVEILDELKEAFLENEKAKKSEEEVKLRVQKSHKRLMMAKDAVWGLHY